MANGWWASLVVVSVSFAQGCNSHSCTLLGWNEGLTVEVNAEEPLTEGVYHFIVEIPGQTFDFELPIEAPKNTEQGFCVSKHIDQSGWQLNASFCGSPGDIVVGRLGKEGGGPKSIAITVEQDGVEIGKLEQDDIAYHRDEPNGPDCGEATTARTSMTITPVQ
jgi:hypothetical protein